MNHNNLPAKKSLGQNFLKNPEVARTMVREAGVAQGDTVLEIGPGTGALTEILLEAGAHVVATEADKRAVEILSERFATHSADGALTLHHADARKQDVTSFIPAEKPYVVVSNIPYYLSGMLIRTCLSARHQPKTIVFLVQKEVAERIARSKKESLLSLSVKAYGEPRYVQKVAKGNFSPVPKVDSAILAIEHIGRKNFKTLDEQAFFKLLHAGFAARRKQLLGNLTELFKREDIVAVFSKLGIPEKARGEDISIQTWISLAEMLESVDE